MKKAIELIEKHKNLFNVLFNDYEGSNRVIRHEMDKIEKQFVVENEMTIQQFKNKHSI